MGLMMSKIISAVKTFVAGESGVTAIEYGLIVALIGLAISAALQAAGAEISATFNTIVATLKAALA